MEMQLAASYSVVSNQIPVLPAVIEVVSGPPGVTLLFDNQLHQGFDHGALTMTRTEALDLAIHLIEHAKKLSDGR